MVRQGKYHVQNPISRLGRPVASYFSRNAITFGSLQLSAKAQPITPTSDFGEISMRCSDQAMALYLLHAEH